jgi:uncharacterized protein involved in response to NO
MQPSASMQPAGSSPLWSRGFRPFFLLAALHAMLFVPLWVAMLRGLVPLPTGLDPVAWHGHEMLFGFAGAAIAGFLLTAVPVWTGTRPVTGTRLARLAGLWLLGRLAFLNGHALPPWALAAADLPFFVALAGALATPLLAPTQRRNAGFVAALMALAVANGLFHLHALGVVLVAPRSALRCGIAVVAVLLIVVGGRITPAFTRTALTRAGTPASILPSPRLDRVAVGAAAVAAAAALSPALSMLHAAASLAAGTAVLVRLAGWRTGRTRRDPLLWSLHAGQAWVGVGLLLSGLSDLWLAVPPTVAGHALTAGAMGAMILAVMTRVSLGHTGRPLVVLPGTSLAYAGVHLGAVVRVAGPLFAPGHAATAWLVAGVLWRDRSGSSSCATGRCCSGRARTGSPVDAPGRG